MATLYEKRSHMNRHPPKTSFSRKQRFSYCDRDVYVKRKHQIVNMNLNERKFYDGNICQVCLLEQVFVIKEFFVKTSLINIFRTTIVVIMVKIELYI